MKRVSESQLQKQGDDLLALDRWRYIETDPKHLRGLGVSEPGIPDRLYLRYGIHGFYPIPVDVFSEAAVLWVEWKRKGGKAGATQLEWHANERARGAVVWLAGVDFPATIEGFLVHYRASGLMRKQLSLGQRGRL